MLATRSLRALGVGRRALLARTHARNSWEDDRKPSVSDWIPGPLEALAFVPRLTVGALLSADSKLPMLQPRLEQLISLAQDQSLSSQEKQVRGITWAPLGVRPRPQRHPPPGSAQDPP